MPIVRMDYHILLIEVTSKSPKRYRQAVENIARFFQQEFGYDGLQYCAESDDGLAFLFIDYSGMNVTDNDKWDLQTIGTICLRCRTYRGEKVPIWTLDWVWLHPFKRNQNELSHYFDKFIKDLGYFYVTPPLSKSMIRFLEKEEYLIEFDRVKEKNFLEFLRCTSSYDPKELVNR